MSEAKSSKSARRWLAAVIVPAIAGAVVTTPACKTEDFGNGVVLEISAPSSSGGDVPRPVFLELDWLDATKGLFRGRRVPQSGTLADDGRPYLAKIIVALDDPALKAFGGGEDSVIRRAVVRASLPGGRVLIGRRRFAAQLGFIVPIETVVIDESDLAKIDEDGDRVPNDIDVCQGADDFLCALDGGSGNDGAVLGNDGGARDAPGGGADAPAVQDGAASDARADAGGDVHSMGDASNGPAAPSDLKPVSLKSNEVQLTWTDNSRDETGFVIERIVGGKFQSVGMTGMNRTTFTDSNLMRSTPYTYQVRAVRGDLQSAPSLPVSVTTPAN